MSESLRQARAVALAAPALLLGGAYVAQYGFGLYPCEMCWWQRYPHFGALALAGMAFVLPAGRRALIALAALAILVSGVIGAYHAGVEFGWWRGLTTCAASVSAGEGDPLDAIMNAPLVRCDVAQWRLIGISLAGWNFVFSTAAALSIGVLLAKKRKAR
ncbi:MAG: disulfide bond formation protein B [Novosphingobium sp.]